MLNRQLACRQACVSLFDLCRPCAGALHCHGRLSIEMASSAHISWDPPMSDFAAARRMMVDCQVRTSDVTDQRIIAAMLDLPRERFVPERNASLAYLDLDVAGDLGRPGAAAAQADGAGEARPGGRDRSAGSRARCRLRHRLLDRAVGAAGAQRRGAGGGRDTRPSCAREPCGLGCGQCRGGERPHCRDGWQAGAPYDVIFVNGAAEVVPERLLRQLAEGGRLVGVVGRAPASKAVLYLASGGQASALPIFDAAAPPLPGFAEPPAFVF